MMLYAAVTRLQRCGGRQGVMACLSLSAWGNVYVVGVVVETGEWLYVRLSEVGR